MTSLFISYSRKDTDCARRLTEAFKAQEFDFWIDWESIPLSVDWWNEVKKGIEQAGVFLFLVSPDSIRSRVCRQEIDHALKNGKRLIPIVVRDVKVEDTPTVLSHLNWIFIRENDDFDAAFSKLVTAIKTDYDWVQAHRDLQVKALEWERSKRGKSFLLSGEALQLAEFQLTTNVSKEPNPTKLQEEYITKSREFTNKRRNTTIVIGTAVGIILTALAIFGWIMVGLENKAKIAANQQASMARTAEAGAISSGLTAISAKATAISSGLTAISAKATAISSGLTAIFNEEKALTQEAISKAEKIRADNSAATAVANEQEAKRQAKIALSRQLAAQAQVLKDEQFDVALLLAIEASRNTSDGQFSLSNLLQAEPHLLRIVSSPKGYIWKGTDNEIRSVVLRSDGNQLIAQSPVGAMFWDLNTYENHVLDSELFQQYANDWVPDQTNPPVPDDLFQTVDFYTLTGSPSVVSNRWAVPACRTRLSAGGARGCASLIYIVEPMFERLVSPLTDCSIGYSNSSFQIDLKGGSYTITGLHGKADQPSDFILYSATLENLASDFETKLVDAHFDPETNHLATVARFGRNMGNTELFLIIWDVGDKKQVMELSLELDLGTIQTGFSNSDLKLDVCIPEFRKGIQIDIDPESWQTQACKIAGRNFTQTEWKYFFDDEAYRVTCPQWPAGE